MQDLTAPGEPLEEGVGRIAGFVNAYVFGDGSGTYLIDTTASRTAKPVRKSSGRVGVNLSQIGTVLLTHEHFDHVRGAAPVQSASRAIVACRSAEALFVEGRVKPKMSALLRLFFEARPVPVQQTPALGDAVPSLQSGETAGLSLFTQYNPHGIFITFEALGYLMMSVALLFAAPVFAGGRAERTIRWLFVADFVLAIVAFIALPRGGATTSSPSS